MKWGKIEQLKNIVRWLENYQQSGLFYDVDEYSDKQIREMEKKMRSDVFQPPEAEQIEYLIEEIKHIVADYHEGIKLDQVQIEWDIIRPKLLPIFHEERVLPQVIVENSPKDE